MSANPSNTFSEEWLNEQLNKYGNALGVLDRCVNREETDECHQEMAEAKAAILKRHKEELLAARVDGATKLAALLKEGAVSTGSVNIDDGLKIFEQLQASNNTEGE